MSAGDNRFERRPPGRLAALDRDASRGARASGSGGELAVGKRTLTEGAAAGYTALDALDGFDRAMGAARAQLAALERAIAAEDRHLAAAAMGSIRGLLAAARGHLPGVPEAERAERRRQLAEL